MSIYDDINNAKSYAAYNVINFQNHMKELPSREFDFLYRQFNYKNAVHYVDSNSKYNLVMKIDNEKQIEAVVKNRKIINVSRSIEGPIIEMNIEGISTSFSFSFDLNEENSLFKIKSIIELKEAMMHFVVYSGGKLVKIFSALLNLDNRIMERFYYMIDLANHGSYPSIEHREISEENVLSLSINYDSAIFEEIIGIVENLQKWGSSDRFSIILDYNDELNVRFYGTLNNLNYVKSQISKKFNLIETGNVSRIGVPFLKYDKGMIYFYKTSFTEDID